MNKIRMGPLGPIPKGWKVRSLKRITKKIGSGATPRGGEIAYLQTRKNFAFVRSQNVFDFHFCSQGLKYIDDIEADKLGGVHLQEDDLLLNITGDGVTFSRCCIVPKEILPAAVNQHVSIIRLDKTQCLPGYLLAYLCHPKTKDYIASFNAGGSRRAITKGHIESFEIPLPSIAVQEKIQSNLFSLISKIELNQRMNKTLEDIAQGIFKCWFVDFEPTRAKMAGESDASICNRLKITPDILALFPDTMEESDDGPKPRGWRLSTIEQEVDIFGGSTPSTKNSTFWEGGTLCWSTPKDLSNSLSPVLLDTERKITEAGVMTITSGQLPPGTLLMSSRAPVGYLAIAEVPISINQGYIAMVCKKTLSNLYMLFWAKQNMDRIKERANGSTFQEISKKNFRPISVLVPGSTLLLKFEDVCRPVYSQIVLNLSQTQILADIRDALLPKLLSGEISVDQTQDEVEGV
jgi:type I restriction enzyme S subunit